MKIKLLGLILLSLFAVVNAQAGTPYDYVCPEGDYRCESERINKLTQYVNETVPEYAKPTVIEKEKEKEKEAYASHPCAQEGVSCTTQR